MGTLVNSGRLSVPAVLAQSPLNTPDRDVFAGGVAPGAVAADAPVEGPNGCWLLDHLGRDFVLMTFGRVADELRQEAIACRIVSIAEGEGAVRDVEGLVARRYDGRAGTCYLVRPDQHVCARWRAFDPAAVRAAIARATSRG